MDIEIRLLPEIMEKIKSDPILYGGIASILGLGPTTLPRLLLNNDARLTQANVLKFIREHLKLDDNAVLLCEEPTVDVN